MAPPAGPRLLNPELSYIVSMAYFSALCLLALWMCRRNFTRLRIFACTLTFFGLSIAIMGYLRAVRIASPCWFWVWNFAGELLAVAGLTMAIVSVGNGFYPMSRNRSVYWALAMGIICIYCTFAVGNIGLYIVTKIVHRHIPYDEVMQLRQKIVAVNMATMEEILAQRLDECGRGRIDTCEVPAEGYYSWRQLSYLEREMYNRPAAWAYMTHQILMLLTCLWVVIYLFIPLVRNHRHGAVGRSVDGDSMAVGVWYLSTLMTLAAIYGALNIYYLTYFELIYHGSIQALDLGIRCTIGPIFFIPAPRCLIEFYRRHFSAMAKSGSNAESRRGGLGSGVATSPRFDGQGSFLGPNFDIRPTTSFTGAGERIGGADPDLVQPQQAYLSPQVVRGSFDILYPTGGSDKDEEGMMTTGGGTMESGPLKRMYGSLKLFQNRNRGLSSESGRQFNQDYPGELEVYDRSSTPPLPLKDYRRSNKERRPSKERPESAQRLTEECLNDEMAGAGQYYYTPTHYPPQSDVDPLNVAKVHTMSAQGLRARPHEFSHARQPPPHQPPSVADAPQEWREKPRVEDAYQDKRDSNRTSGDGGSFGVSPAEWRRQQQRRSLDLLQDSEERGRQRHRGSLDSSRASFPRLQRRSYTHSQLEEEAMRRASSGSAGFADPPQEYTMSALSENDKAGSVSDMSQKPYPLDRRSSEVTRSMFMRDDDYYDIAGRDSYIEVPRQGYGGFTTRDRTRLSIDSSWSRAAGGSGGGGGGGGGQGSPFSDVSGTPGTDYLPELQDSLVSHAVDPAYWTRAPESGTGGARRPNASKANRDSVLHSLATAAVDSPSTNSTKPGSKLQQKPSRTLLGIGGGSGGSKKKEPKEKETPTADKKSTTKTRWWQGHRRDSSAGTTQTAFANDAEVPPTPSTATSPVDTTGAGGSSSATMPSGPASNTASSITTTTKSRASAKANKGGASETLKSSGTAGNESTTTNPKRGIEGAIEELTKAAIQCPRVAEEAARLAEESLWAQYDYPDPYYDESTYRKFLKPNNNHLDGDRSGGAISPLDDPPQTSSPPMPAEARASIQLHAAQLETRGIKSSLEITSSPITLSGQGDGVYSGNTPGSPSPASGRTSFGAFLSRTASGSKRLVPPKLKPRGLRSKSDANNNNSNTATTITTTTASSAQNHGSQGGQGMAGGGLGGAGNRTSADGKSLKPQTALPITATRPNPPPEEDPSLAYNIMMASTSLSPPPRQTNWMTRARASSQVVPVSATMWSTEREGYGHNSLGKGAAKSSALSVDTAAANAAHGARKDPRGDDGSASAESESVASLSPRTASTGPQGASSVTSPGSASGGTGAGSQQRSLPSSPGSPPLSPQSDSAGRRSESSDISLRAGAQSLLGGMTAMDSRRQYSQQQQHQQQSSQPQQGTTMTNGSTGKSRPSSPPMTDNLAQAYYLNKKAQQAAAAAAAAAATTAKSALVSEELPSVASSSAARASPSTMAEGFAAGASNLSAPPTSAVYARGGYSYYGTHGSNSSSESTTPRRGSPSPDSLEAVNNKQHQHQQQHQQQQQKSSTVVDIGRPISPPLSSHEPHFHSAPIVMRPLSPPSSPDPIKSLSASSSPAMAPTTRTPHQPQMPAAAASRTSNLTNHVRYMADDAWTQAMVARAQNSTASRP
ncbi:hypothetical protein BGZ73_002128 [Actinomortierella ambigua]|nr:hypothetical protein BGZ73_002128 [Actinomortierella ambigua]